MTDTAMSEAGSLTLPISEIIRTECESLVHKFGREYLYLFDDGKDNLILHLDYFGDVWMDEEFQGVYEKDLGYENPYFWWFRSHGKEDWVLTEIPWEFCMFEMTECPVIHFYSYRKMFDYLRHKIEQFIARPYTVAEIDRV